MYNEVINSIQNCTSMHLVAILIFNYMKISALTGPQNAAGCSTDTISVRTSNVNIDIQLVSQSTRSSSLATEPIIHQRRTEPYRFEWKSHDPNDPRNTTIELPCIEEEKPGVQDTA